MTITDIHSNSWLFYWFIIGAWLSFSGNLEATGLCIALISVQNYSNSLNHLVKGQAEYIVNLEAFNNALIVKLHEKRK